MKAEQPCERLSAATEEWRRRRAVELHQSGWSSKAIAEALGVGPSAVSNWLKAVREGGLEALRTRRHQTGQWPKLTPEQKQRLLEMLRSGAEEQISIGERWTGKRVAALIRREFGVSYHPEYVPRLLRSLKWTPQVPEVKASQQDEQKVEAFRANWPQVKKGQRQKDASLSL